MIIKAKTKKVLFLIPFIYLFIGIRPGFSQNNAIIVLTGSSDKQLSFAYGEIKKAAVDNGYAVKFSKTMDSESNNKIIVKIISDSVSAVKIARSDYLRMPEHFGWQCYSVRIKKEGGQTVLYILSGDKTGAMYGGLDIAEAIHLGTINNLSESDNRPYLERRGIKFNIPLDMRTPSYSDMSDAGQQNIPVIWNSGSSNLMKWLEIDIT